ncbi:DUF3224 domain-containing protein [Amycolatopsis sp.]|jgi:hypothetical protein|uniref:DUF3224 domain-containing protein n=1 Tax=Amycolatopsis sp. TaxID=37632 RepID=UPI002E0B8D96|nr:DUF3224 domain-containing protein [Amycolatopsis sp.]
MTDNAFTMKSWDEHLVSGEEGTPRVAHAHAVMRYAGIIDGDSTCDFLLFYPGEGFDGGATTSPGLERIEGNVAGRKGSFVVRHEVGFDLNGLQGTFTVVAGSGTGELSGLTGSGTVAGTMGQETVSYTFEYEIG